MNDPLSNTEAFTRFLTDFEETITVYTKNNVNGELASFCFRWPLLSLFFLLVALLFIGAVELDNTLSCPLLLSASGALFLWIVLLLLNARLRKCRRQKRISKARRVFELMKKIDPESVHYERILEPPSDEWICYSTLRKGYSRPLTIPTLLLTTGDILLLRPGQSAPCLCKRIVDDFLIERGQKLETKIERDPETGAAAALEPIKCQVVEAPIRQHLETVLNKVDIDTSLDLQVKRILNVILVRFLLPFSIMISIALAIFRFYTCDGTTLFGKRFSFSVPAAIILPMICPVFPLFYFICMLWNNMVVLNFLHCGSIKKSNSSFRVIRGIFDRLLDKEFCSVDLVSVFGSLTAICFVDKKGIVSSPNPILDKLFFFTKLSDELELGVETKSFVVPEVLELSGEKVSKEWVLDFDDPTWERFLDSLLPIGENVRLNGCAFLEDYLHFLDHTTCVAETVPRTIAVASRRCLCQLPRILCLEQDEAKQQQEVVFARTVGLYKRIPGHEPLPGMIRHRTPLEGAFCTIQADERSLHLHLAAQGTATVILNSCSHIWDGASLKPLTDMERRAALDFYNRHSMTGYCLALSYRAVGGLPAEKLIKQYLEVGAGGRIHGHQFPNTESPVRSHSTESLSHQSFFNANNITQASDLLDAYFQGHVFNGMVVMQYQAEPSIVSLVEAVEADAIRFVYFSRENELRSRVFAEKLGLEAGWNCHVSLAESETTIKSAEIFAALFRKSSRGNNNRLSSQLSLPLATEHCMASRYSPFMRTTSKSSGHKVGPLLNKAQLPQGVSAVRPHLEEVDNVPLQVGLFTDATPMATREMITIMQEYGEVVLIVGSSLNVSNGQIFAQGNISICVEPLRDHYHADFPPKSESSSTKIASKLMALGADFRLKHEQLSVLPNLISACRHRLYSMRISLQFLLFLSLSLSLIVALSTALYLPIIFKPDQIMLFSCLIFPLTALSPIAYSFEPKEKFVKIAGKNADHVNRKEINGSVWTFMIQFLPTVGFTVFIYFIMLVRHVHFECEFSDLVCSSVIESSNYNGETFSNLTTTQLELTTEQVRHLAAFQLTVSTVIHSASWASPLFPLYHSLSIFRPLWITASSIVIILQLLFTRILLGKYAFAFFTTPLLLAIITWNILMVIVNEGRKFTQRRLFMREQRRRKLAFDTKLGMNSPY